MKKSVKQITKENKRHYRPVVAFVVGMITAVIMGTLVVDVFSTVSSRPSETVSSDVEEVQDAGVGGVQYASLERSAPQSLRIPRIQLEAEFEGSLGVNEDGAVEVPTSYEEVGWYKYGPTPGEIGPAVVLGHVDSYEGPAVFYSLGQVEKGDMIYVERSDGITVEFQVTKLERRPQGGFPTASVYGDIDHAGLRLITCTGIYDRSVFRYTHNLIVYAEMTGLTDKVAE